MASDGVVRGRLLVLCPHPEDTAPGQRFKYEQYLDDFRAAGWAVDVSPFMSMRFWKIVYGRGRFFEKVAWTVFGYLRRLRDLLRAPRYTAVYVFLWVTPLGPPLFEWLMRARSRRLIYDIDDMVFLGHSSRANRFWQFLKGKAKMIALMRGADHVVTCTPYLDAFVRRYNQRTTDISSTINTVRYQPVPRRAPGRLTIGWSGSHSTAPYLHLLGDVLRELRQHVEFRLLVIGEPDFTMMGIEVDARPFRTETEVADLAEMDIGVYPLPDQLWVQGKSGLKALQYMALGIPTVATAVGANFRVMEDGVSGFLVSSPAEWRTRLEQLAADADLRARIGEAARQRVEATYSVAANRHRYLAILDTVLRARQ